MKSITLHASSPITVTLKANQRRRITKLQFSHSILSSPSSYFNNQTKKTQHFPRNQITNLNILVEVLLSLTYLLIARMAVLAALISASSLVLAAAPLYWMPLISTLAGVRTCTLFLFAALIGLDYILLLLSLLSKQIFCTNQFHAGEQNRLLRKTKMHPEREKKTRRLFLFRVDSRREVAKAYKSHENELFSITSYLTISLDEEQKL